MKNVVFNQNGKVLTNSLLVAEKFGKRHANVIKAVEDHINDLNSTDSKVSWFCESEYCDGKGEMRKMYIMNRDGFTLLAMGFTGKKALQFKLEYIEAFNSMESQLKQLQESPNLQIPTTLSGALRLAADQAEIIESQKKQLAEQSENISQLEPKAKYTEDVLLSTNTISITQIAKDYGMTGVALNKKLNIMGVIYKVNNQWVLYKKHEGKGYTKSITYKDEHQRSYLRTEWTQIGRQFIDSLLR